MSPSTSLFHQLVRCHCLKTTERSLRMFTLASSTCPGDEHHLDLPTPNYGIYPGVMYRVHRHSKDWAIVLWMRLADKGLKPNSKSPSQRRNRPPLEAFSIWTVICFLCFQEFLVFSLKMHFFLSELFYGASLCVVK